MKGYCFTGLSIKPDIKVRFWYIASLASFHWGATSPFSSPSCHTWYFPSFSSPWLFVLLGIKLCTSQNTEVTTAPMLKQQGWKRYERIWEPPIRPHPWEPLPSWQLETRYNVSFFCSQSSFSSPFPRERAKICPQRRHLAQISLAQQVINKTRPNIPSGSRTFVSLSWDPSCQEVGVQLFFAILPITFVSLKRRLGLVNFHKAVILKRVDRSKEKMWTCSNLVGRMKCCQDVGFVEMRFFGTTNFLTHFPLLKTGRLFQNPSLGNLWSVLSMCWKEIVIGFGSPSVGSPPWRRPFCLLLLNQSLTLEPGNKLDLQLRAGKRAIVQEARWRETQWGER